MLLCQGATMMPTLVRNEPLTLTGKVRVASNIAFARDANGPRAEAQRPCMTVSIQQR
jgi:hypothetical protein